MEEKIEKLRKNIDNTDFEILGLLSRRMDLISKIAIEKKEMNLSVTQKKREKDALIKRLKIGDKLNLKPQFIKKLFQLILQESKRIQHRSRKDLPATPALTKRPEL